jgi:predicted esterase
MNVMLSLLLAALLQTPTALPSEIIPHDWLVIAPTDIVGRRPFRPDAVFARHLLDPHAAAPEKDQKLTGETDKEVAWTATAAKDDGTLDGDIGWAYTAIESSEERVMMAQLTGAARLFVNGTGFVGDLYAYGFGGVPIVLSKGTNHIYVNGVRGSCKLRLWTPPSSIVFADWDQTKCDVVEGEKLTDAGPSAFLWWNASNADQKISTSFTTERLAFDALLRPLAPVKLPWFSHIEEPIEKTDGHLHRTLELLVGKSEVPRNFDVSFDVRRASEARRRTFQSGIDGSVQFYGWLPALAPHDAPGLVLSLHGASVDALNQVRSYSAKSDFCIAAPTNRRPYGFDWQDWGRIDAHEVLRLAEWFAYDTVEDVDKSNWGALREYLTGHSMGGHGTWNIAANDPGTFLAIAPSAGWASFDTYGGRPEGLLKSMWHAADASSDTLALISNLAQIPTYIVHGTADDNVPVSEAQRMQKALEDAGAKPLTHYQEGAGHWWDGDASPGADCVDWPGIFDLFRATKPRVPTATIDFTTVDPGVCHQYEWVYVVQPLVYGKCSRVRAHLDADDNTLVIATENVRGLVVTDGGPYRHVEEIVPGWNGAKLRIDDDVLTFKDDNDVPQLLRVDGHWRVESYPTGFDGYQEKKPYCSGPFKRAFDNRFVLVFGTHGTPDENRELFERARYDLETWWYRANGTPALISDSDYLAQEMRDDNVILYGNSDTNSAWALALAACPIQARRGSLKLGEREWKGDDLSAVVVYPTEDWAKGDAGNRGQHLVGAFADTGVKGTRLGYELAPFSSGVGYPDYAVFSAEILSKGDLGVLAAGWFDHAWQLDSNRYLRDEDPPAPRKTDAEKPR